MNTIRIENLRSLKDTGVINLSPLTILLGNNSSGKSTFLRTFPLLKQSFQDKILGPITLFGSLVDFGDFDTAITKNCDNKNISISLNYNIPEKDLYFFRERNKKYDQLYPLELQMVFNKYETSEVIYISYCKISILDEVLELFFSKSNDLNKIKLNDTDFSSELPDTSVLYKDGNFFPSFQSSSNQPLIKRNAFLTPLISLYKESIPESEKEKNKSKEDAIFTYNFRNFDFYPILGKKLKQADLNHFIFRDGFSDEIYNKIKKNKIKFDTFSDCLFLSQIPHLLSIIENTLSKEMKNLYYSKPLRANAERYYRIQPLAVDEVSADGRNIISFINNLTNEQRQKFESWINSNFDFEIQIQPHEGHQSLLIKNREDEEFSNISDMGFGFSQIIPIITQLWSINDKISNSDETINAFTFAIEQPELHLHPKMQRELMKTFCSTIQYAKDKNIDVKIILETHSEKMINYLGELIEEKIISNKDVSILLFEKENKLTNIRNVVFNEKGYLKDWPINFF